MLFAVLLLVAGVSLLATAAARWYWTYYHGDIKGHPWPHKKPGYVAWLIGAGLCGASLPIIPQVPAPWLNVVGLLAVVALFVMVLNSLKWRRLCYDQEKGWHCQAHSDR